MLNPTSPALIEAEEVAQQLDDPELVVLDATFFLPGENRSARQNHLDGRIPGARFFDIDLIADRESPLPHMLPAPDAFAASVGRLGVGQGTRIVLYDGNQFMASARAWWSFRVFGHDRVSVLDGGLSRWLSLGYPLESGPPGPVRACPPFQADFQAALIADRGEMLERMGSPEHQIIDARPPGRFLGTEPEPRPGLRSGHIPGSRSLFFRHLIDPSSHCLKEPDELAHLFEEAGIDPRRPITTTCGSGVTAAIIALALFTIDLKSTAVYDGSWSEWGQPGETPVEVG